MESKKKEFTYKTETDPKNIENKPMATKVKGRGDKLGDLDWHIYTIDAMYKTEN